MQVFQVACQQQFASSPLQLEILSAGMSDRPQKSHKNLFILKSSQFAFVLRDLSGEIAIFESLVINHEYHISVTNQKAKVKRAALL